MTHSKRGKYRDKQKRARERERKKDRERDKGYEMVIEKEDFSRKCMSYRDTAYK